MQKPGLAAGLFVLAPGIEASGVLSPVLSRKIKFDFVK